MKLMTRPQGDIIVMDLPNEQAAREAAERLVKTLQPGASIIVTDESGKEVYVTMNVEIGRPH